jgi:S1-C subfamily serine protease
MGKPLVDQFPYPFQVPMAQELLRTLASLFRTEREATALAERFSVDPLAITPGLSPLNLWHELLEKLAIAGTLRATVTEVRRLHPNNARGPFLDALLANRSAPVSAEPLADPEFDDSVSEREALLFFDDLTMPAGHVPKLVATLRRLMELAPAICLLRVSNAFGEFYGTGFRIAHDLVLTNEHVLFPNDQKATKVHADFGFDVDADGASTEVVSLAGDISSIVGDDDDDWAIVRVYGMDNSWPIIALDAAPEPTVGERAYIVQHPAGQRKRVGFVRNTISDLDDHCVRYLTDTEPGSSGAPVFDSAGRVIALHHAGGRASVVAGKPPVQKNEGIRISRVLAALKANGALA